MSKIGKAKGCLGGIILGSAIRALIFILSAIIKGLASVMVFFGLWVPFFYAIFGGILYLIFQFDPFSGSIDSKIYIAGFAGTVLCSLLITVKHLFQKPAESVAEGFKKPIWKSRDEDSEYEEDHRLSRKAYGRSIRRYEEEDDYIQRDEDYRPSSRQKYSKPARDDYQKNDLLTEKPKIYYSAREEDILVHEYSDRFEVFRMVNGKAIPDKVEYKNL